MHFSIPIQKRANHPLILGSMLASLTFEKVNASLGQRNGHFLRILPKYELSRRRKKILNYAQAPKCLICVFYWLFHKNVDLASNSLRRKCG
jgi:hypothetical protein